MADMLGDAFRCIAASVAQMQEAMWTMNQKMERTNDAVCTMAQRLKAQGKAVSRLDKRMNQLEQAPAAAPNGGGAFPAPSYCPGYAAYAGGAGAVGGGWGGGELGGALPRSMSCTAAAGDWTTSSLTDGAACTPTSAWSECRSPAAPARCASCAACAPGVASCCAPCPIVDGPRLLKAVQKGRVRRVRRLLALGADANYCAEGRWAPLHCACARCNAPIASLLLGRGANVNAKTAYGFTPLHIAADNDYSGRCVLLLLAGGADHGSRNRTGRTPLHYAAECGNEAGVRALVAAGASKTAEDDRGKTPYDLAKTLCVRRLLQPCAQRGKACCFVHDVTRFEFNCA